MDRFKNVAKGGWHPEKSAAASGGAGGNSDSKLGQVVCAVSYVDGCWTVG